MVELRDLVIFAQIILPSLFMLAAVIYIVGGFFRDHEKRQKLKVALGNKQMITPLRLQAYERLVMLLERISLESLMMRVSLPGKNCEELHAELLQIIRAEFDHNLSQQLYVSIEAWNSVRKAKNYTISLVNNAAKEVEDKAPAILLSRKILDMAIELEKSITEKALNEIKLEIQQIF